MNPLYIYLLIGINSTCVLSCCAYFCYTIHLHKKQHKIRETNIKNSIHELDVICSYSNSQPPPIVPQFQPTSKIREEYVNELVDEYRNRYDIPDNDIKLKFNNFQTSNDIKQIKDYLSNPI